MLTYEDEASIKNGIWKRLHRPGRAEIADIQVINRPTEQPPHIQVGVWIVLRDRVQDGAVVDLRSFFDLPAEFDLRHLHNEIDEISEHVKKARAETTVGRLLWAPDQTHPRQAILGTGLRGRWKDGAAVQQREPGQSA